jgi:hypothetical protein
MTLPPAAKVIADALLVTDKAFAAVAEKFGKDDV